ncbi:hypothetical protein QUB19_26955 [Microcoleus sp. B4-C5]|uniref:hypothetical protein n=1 Tax=unclassified Microcoleus TaxID=2642155 RepID=UPI002FD2D8C3
MKTVGQRLKVFYVKSVPELILMRVKALEFALAQVSKNEIRNWFTHCCYCTSRLLGNAIVAGTFKGKSFGGVYRYTRTYLKENGQWRIIAAQAMAIAS